MANSNDDGDANKYNELFAIRSMVVETMMIRNSNNTTKTMKLRHCVWLAVQRSITTKNQRNTRTNNNKLIGFLCLRNNGSIRCNSPLLTPLGYDITFRKSLLKTWCQPQVDKFIFNFNYADVFPLFLPLLNIFYRAIIACSVLHFLIRSSLKIVYPTLNHKVLQIKVVSFFFSLSLCAGKMRVEK